MNLSNELNYLLNNSNPVIIDIIQLGISISEIESCISEELYINQETEDGIIATIDGVELYFSKEKKLYMWLVKPFDNDFYFLIKGKKYKMNKLNFKKIMYLLSISKTEWVFNQKFCFLDQLCVTLNNQVSFLFGFDEKGKNSLVKMMGKMSDS